MNSSAPQVPRWLDLACIGVGAFQGALYAIVSHRFDLVGVSIVALVTGLGGGTVRDLLLANGRPVTDIGVGASQSWDFKCGSRYLGFGYCG